MASAWQMKKKKNPQKKERQRWKGIRYANSSRRATIRTGAISVLHAHIAGKRRRPMNHISPNVSPQKKGRGESVDWFARQ